MEKARRRHVPAFGEWNYYYHYDVEPESKMAAECGYAPEPEACSDVWFKYSPPPRRALAPKKARTPEKQGRGRAFDARAPAKGSCSSRVVRPVDKDLYQVPPPDFVSHHPRRKRSLLMGCLGLNSCVAWN